MKTNKLIFAFIIYFVCFVFTNSQADDDYELRFAFEMIRHGARAPWDPNITSTFPDLFGEQWPGDGELTGVGLRQHYLLGARNRIRFDGFLSKSYDPNEIYVISTDFNRTIMSVNAHLQGLYQNTGPLLSLQQVKIAHPPLDYNFDKEKEKLGFAALPNEIQVVPVHIFDKRGRTFYLHDPDVCPASFNFRQQNLKNETIFNTNNQILAKYGDILQKSIQNRTWYDVKADYDSLYRTFDTFLSDYTDGRELKALVNNGMNLTEFNETAYNYMFNDMFFFAFGDPDRYIGRMSMSPTHRQILDWMNTRINKDNKNEGYSQYAAPKLVIYSGHDTNLAAMQTFLTKPFGLTNYVYVPYATSMFYMLYRAKVPKDAAVGFTEADYQVRIMVNDKELIGRMSFTEFKKNITESLISPEEIANFCQFDVVKPSFSSTIYMISTIALAILSLALLIYLIITMKKNKPEVQQVDYQTI